MARHLESADLLEHIARTAEAQVAAAWELATRKLGYIVNAYVAVKPLITAAFERVDQTVGEDEVANAQRR